MKQRLLFTFITTSFLTIHSLCAQTPSSDAFSDKGKAAIVSKQFDSAVYYYTKAIQIAPTVFNYHHNRGLSYYNKFTADTGHSTNAGLDAAVKDFTNALALNPNFWKSYWMRGETYMLYYTRPTYPRLDLAIADFTKALSYDKENYSLLVSRGDAYSKDPYQYHDEAIADYTHALQINNSDRYVYMQRAFMYRIKTEYANAIANYDSALSRARSDADRAYLLIQQGKVFELYDKPERALFNYLDANKLFPSKKLEDMAAAAQAQVMQRVNKNITNQSANLPNSDSLVAAVMKEDRQRQAQKAAAQVSNNNQKYNPANPGFSNSNVCPACNGSGRTESFGRKMEYVDIKDWQGRVIGTEFKPVDGFHSEKCRRCGGSGKN